MEYALRVINVTKVFNNKEVVSNVNLNIKQGEIYGVLGPNGAGKTTVMKMIMNLIKPTSGEIEILGEKITNQSYEVLKRLGSIIEYPIFYEKLTARENLELHCEYMGYHDKDEIDNVLSLVKLSDINNKQVKFFSLGMKQRLGIARAILTKPEILILDEPINGLDPVGIKEMRDLFKMLCKEYGITILISSHILGEIEQIADTIGLIVNGNLIQEVSMERVREENVEYIEITTDDVKKATYILEIKLNIINFKIIDDKIIRIYEESIPQNQINKTLVLNDISIEGIIKKKASLEDYFLKIIKGEGIIV